MTPEPHGWYVDPFGRHEARYFSEGKPSKLVRDGGRETYDPPPSETFQATALRPAELHDDNADVPDRVFQGQTFERRWGGSRGYEQRDAEVGGNWVDRLIIPAFTILRPSRFQEPTYWTRSVPIVFLLSTVIVIVALLALGVL
jgi:hypothetical protein